MKIVSLTSCIHHKNGQETNAPAVPHNQNQAYKASNQKE